jgi:hypothetical protein
MAQTHESVRDMLKDFFFRMRFYSGHLFETEINGNKVKLTAAQIHEELQREDSVIAQKLMGSANYFDSLIKLAKQMQESEPETKEVRSNTEV